MYALSKVVISKTVGDPPWSNTRVIINDVPACLKGLKQQAGKDMVILGSSQLAADLIKQGLIDEYRIIVTPVLLRGRKIFNGITETVALNLSTHRSFASGNVLLCYHPA